MNGINRADAQAFGLANLYDKIAKQEGNRDSIDTKQEEVNFKFGIKMELINKTKNNYYPTELLNAYQYFYGSDFITGKPCKTDTDSLKNTATLYSNVTNYAESYEAGKLTAKNLIGYTTQKEAQETINLMLAQDKTTIIGFIQGYNDNDKVLGIKYGEGGIIDQLDNESSFDDNYKGGREGAINNIINSVLEVSRAAGINKVNCCQYNELLNNYKTYIEKHNTEQLDILVTFLVNLISAKMNELP